MPTMRALKAFLHNGRLVRKGHTIEVAQNRVDEYERNELAEVVKHKTTKKKTTKKQEE
jgi:ABC-type glutathione transport system ATPase component